MLVGYLVVAAPDEFDRGAARDGSSPQRLPSAIVPLLALVDDLPVRTSGKVDRAALPWPLPGVEAPAVDFTGTEAWLAEQWQSVLGMPVPSRSADFFDLGGGSLAAAQLVSRIRTRVPEFSVADIYDVPRLGAMAKALGVDRGRRRRRRVPPARADAALDAVGADARRLPAVHPHRHPLAALPAHRERPAAARAGLRGAADGARGG